MHKVSSRKSTSHVPTRKSGAINDENRKQNPNTPVRQGPNKVRKLAKVVLVEEVEDDDVILMELEDENTPLSEENTKKQPLKDQKSSKSKSVQGSIKEERNQESKLSIKSEDAIHTEFNQLNQLMTKLTIDHDEEIEIDESSEKKFKIDDVVIHSLLTEIGKLKRENKLVKIEKEKIIELYSIMKALIESGNDLKYTKQTFHQIKSCFEGILIIFNFLTMDFNENQGKYLVSEEMIEIIINLIANQLDKNLLLNFSEFTENKTKIKGNSKGKEQMQLLNLLGEVFDQLNELINRINLPDRIIIDISSKISLTIFFSETQFSENLQIKSIHLLRSIFAKYQSHRSLILQEIFNSLLKLPLNKRNQRKYKIKEETKTSKITGIDENDNQNTEISIQMLSGLIIQLIQSCTSSSSQLAPQSLQESIICARNFLNFFLQKCFIKNSNQSDYKTILENFVDDLILLLFLPDWPAAEMILSILSSILLVKLNQQHDSRPENHSNLLDVSSHLLILKLLGLISSRMAKEISEFDKINLFHDNKRRLGNSLPSDEEEDARCICNNENKLDERFMLDCDRCNIWFHGECVGIHPNEVPTTWYCDNCSIIQQIEEKIKLNNEAAKKLKNSKNKKKSSEMETEENKNSEENIKKQVCLQLICNYLLLTKNDKISANYARKFIINLFLKNFPELKEFCEHQWEFKKQLGNQTPSLSTKGTFQAFRFISIEKDFISKFHSILSAILLHATDKQISFRSAAIKILANIIEADPRLLGELNICKTIEERRLDVSVSVRQAVIDLVGNYILYQPEYKLKYYKMIVDRIADTGTSVRKSVIKILMNICLKSENKEDPLINEICCQLVTRINDEESIKSIIIKTFMELWFAPLISNSNSKKSEENKKYIQLKLNQMTSVVSSTTSHQWFIELVKNLIESEKSKKKKQIYQFCEALTNEIIENLIEIEEKFNEIQRPTTEETGEYHKRVISHLLLFNLFIKSENKLISNHLITLHAYLQNNLSENTQNNSVIIYLIIEIIEESVPQLVLQQKRETHSENGKKKSKNKKNQKKNQENEIDFGASSEFLLGLEEDLSNLIQHSNSMKVVQGAARCLCLLVLKLTKHFVFVEEMLETVCEYLESHYNAKKPQSKALSPAEMKKKQEQILRNLFISGLICRYFDFEAKAKNSQSKDNKKSSKGKNTEKTIEKVFKIYLKSIKDESIAVQEKTLVGLGHLYIKAPKLMLESDKIFKYSLTHKNPQIRTQILKTISEYLQHEKQLYEKMNKSKKFSIKSAANDEESENEEEEESEKKNYKELNEEINEDQSDYAVRALQLNLELIIPMLFDPRSVVRMDALIIVGELIKHGLSHPVIVSKYLIALLSDSRTLFVPEKAFYFLKFIHEKHPSILLNRIAEGIKLSFDFQVRLFNHANALTISKSGKGPESVFANLYSLFKSKKTTRHQFLDILVDLILASDGNGPLLKYIADSIAFLPFTMVGEPLRVIHQLDRIISLKTGSVCKQFKLQLAKEKDAPLNKLAGMSISACLSIVALKLKGFLKWGYSLSTSKCENYSASDASNNAPCVKVLDSITVMSPFSDIPVLHASDAKNTNVCREQYLLMKKLFKQDDLDRFNSLDSSIAPKTPKLKRDRDIVQATSTPMKAPAKSPSTTKKSAGKAPQSPKRSVPVNSGNSKTKKRGRKSFSEMYIDDEQPQKKPRRSSKAFDDDDDFVPN